MNSLNDICYEHIKDSFYYSVFGDFKLIIDKNTGYFNATKLCKDGGKKFYNWSRLDKSKDLINYFNINCHDSYLMRENFNKKYIKIIENNNVMYEIIGNKQTEENKLIVGTYVSEDLILSISNWISNEFYNQCNKIVKKYFIEEYNKNYKNNEENLNNKIKEIENNYINIIHKNKEIISDLTDKNNELIDFINKQNIELNENNDKLNILTIKQNNKINDRIIIINYLSRFNNNILIYKLYNNTININKGYTAWRNHKNPNVSIFIDEYVPDPGDIIKHIRDYSKCSNKKIRKDIIKYNKHISKNEYNSIYSSKKIFELSYNRIILNNSTINDIICVYRELKEALYSI
ncbi:N1R/p28-like protein [Mythimna separata entomopoxvirus 'L']|uniref:N1R/p28-like protein n=1 Tax=Mythimna separata entomopoxvirus 'L' TaxID=1293572 RepID=A0A916KQB3_9POXV|nr:N1R/p28-like protein [Mythimna separata entomopoxvirus 'L']CCU56358.1 N1R/p28-like protein [Mythimna separata entomopoxvirus 'L']